jgi:hypothetical protein
MTDSVLPEHAVNLVPDGEFDPFRFVKESDDGVQVNRLALTYKI